MATHLKLEHLRLKAFRGATQEVLIPFDPLKRATLIFGENGTGKSTVVDSLTYLCDGSFGSLADRADAKKYEYLTSISAQPSDVFVELKIDGKLVVGRQPKANPPHLSAPGKPAISVLRRATLSEFVEAIPSKRFEKLKPFLATSNIELAEGSLRKEATEAEQQSFRFQRDLVGKREALKKLWESESDKSVSAEVWAKQVGGLNVAHEQAYCDATDAVETFKSKAEQQKLEVLTALSSLDVAAAASVEAKVRLEKASGTSHSSGESLLLTLKSAAKHLKEHGGDECPVCERAIEVGTLSESLGARIAAMNDLDAAVNEFTRVEQSQKQASAVLDTQRSIWLKRLQETLSGLNDHAQWLGDMSQILGPLQALMNSPLDLALVLQESTQFEVDLSAWLEPHRVESAQKCKRINLKNAAYQALDAVAVSTQKTADSETLEKALKAALGIVEEQRKLFIRDALKQVSGDIDLLYSKLHPGESLNTIKLALKEGLQGSLDITANFETKVSVPPQAYYSEAHLDTLGICIFIAFAKKYAAKSSLIVLDDVLTSVDSVHLDRFIDFIDDESSHFGHVVMTTHYRPWRDRFRFHQAASSHLHFIELKEWELSRGLLHDQTKTTLDELKAALDPQKFDRQIAASKAGIFLERIYDFLTVKYQAKMPRKTVGDYTLGEFGGAFQTKHLKQLEIELIDGATGVASQRVSLEPLFNAIDQFAWIRNQVGCHFNAGAAGASDSDVRKFAGAVVALGDAIVCPAGGDFPEREGGSFWQSKAKTCRLYPHKMI